MDANRYNRQIILPDFGISAQKKLSESSVLVVGAGGLGCPVLQVLVAAGIQHIGIVDFDMVELHNLHRQFLFNESDVGKPKVLAAEKHLQKMNSDTEIRTFHQKITPENVLSVIQDYNVVVDCTDNFSTRYIINDACFILEKPLVYGSIFRYEGQVAVFNVVKDEMITSYRDLFPVPPKPDEIPNCNEAGVLPTLSSIIGTIQANEVIKLLTGSDDVLVHKLLVFNSKDYQTMIIGFEENINKVYPENQKELETFDYGNSCSIGDYNEISSYDELEVFLQNNDSVLIDVREAHELPRLTSLKHMEIPLGNLNQHLELLENYNSICFICASGIRSKKALEITQSYFPEKQLTHYSPGAKSILL
ncbi:ThiF family adenylyltransferase [Chryseobacterium sp.]|uniref:ThiF family adenylyltransferase n=1 Tax=Chryseobacterium sp. TaxID=1871047 RepID=UPI0025BC10B6|nr:ThiF family adenylyltransferase [Chryseobacterium sp.]